jgi:hypothetical protein
MDDFGQNGFIFNGFLWRRPDGRAMGKGLSQFRQFAIVKPKNAAIRATLHTHIGRFRQIEGLHQRPTLRARHFGSEQGNGRLVGESVV